MKALRYHLEKSGAYTLRVDDLPSPKPLEDEVLIRVAFCGICGSDISRYHQSFNPTRELRQALGDVSSTVGHEISGIVVALGPRVAEYWDDKSPVLGSQVVVNPLIGCGACPSCQSGHWNHCDNGKLTLIGLRRNGGFSHAVTVPFDHIVRIAPSSGLPLEIAALTEPLAVAVHTVEKARISNLSMPITVIGDGPIGLLICHVLKQIGCQAVQVLGRHPTKLAIAQKLSADSVSVADHLTDRAKSELVFQAAGSLAAIQNGLKILAPNGFMICLGYLSPKDRRIDPVTFNTFIRHNQSLLGSFGYSHDSFSRALDGLGTGRFRVSPLIAKKIPLEAAREHGFEALRSKLNLAGKILVYPTFDVK